MTVLPPRFRLLVPALAAGALVLAAAGCGGGSGSGAAATAAPVPPAVKAAQTVPLSQFPKPNGRSLQEVANALQPGPQVGLASSVFTPGVNRVAFGLIGADGGFLYAPSAIYVARTPNSPAEGPYPAPTDPMTVRPPYQSRSAAAGDNDIKAVYAAHVRFNSSGPHALLVATRSGGKLLGGTTTVEVAKRTPIPGVGDRPPAIATPTVASAGGDVRSIDTRIPPDDMHQVSFKDALGHKPIALLFATPQFCQSRVCGPVTDIALQMQAAYGKRMVFIHNEVYRDNNPKKGLRPQLLAFHLRTEPWLFVVNAKGRIVARLEGAFGVDAFRAAVQKALRT